MALAGWLLADSDSVSPVHDILLPESKLAGMGLAAIISSNTRADSQRASLRSSDIAFNTQMICSYAAQRPN